MEPIIPIKRESLFQRRVLRAFQPVKTDPAISGIHIRCLNRDYELVDVKQNERSLPAIVSEGCAQGSPRTRPTGNMSHSVGGTCSSRLPEEIKYAMPGT